MNKEGWKILVGTGVIIAVIWLAFGRVEPTGDKANLNADIAAETRVGKLSIPKNNSQTNAGVQSSQDGMIEPMSGLIDKAGLVAMDADLILQTPDEQTARSFASTTANMSMAQMAELQKKRQGKIVRDVSGRLTAPYVEREKCDGNDACKAIIINSNSGEIVWDGVWVKGFVETGVGEEVVAKRN